jgi:hypothetical protein
VEFQETPEEKLREWFKRLDKRQQNEVVFARIYKDEFGHGTDGHNRLTLIATMAEMLDELEDTLTTGEEAGEEEAE